MNGKTPRVVDFSTHLSGPVASRQLVHLGADVIKVESPRVGDGNRTTPPFIDGVGMYHVVLNPGARSVAADIRSSGWPRLVEALAKWADVVIVGNRPEAAARYGIDFRMIAKHNPQIVYCQITGYGLDGPLSGTPAHGLNMDAYAGVIPVEWKDGMPVAAGAYRSAGTTLAGIYAAMGIYAALHNRTVAGGTQFVHVSVWEAAVSWMWRDVASYLNTGEPWLGYRDRGSRYCMYGTADKRAILVCPVEQHFWERFCDVVGLRQELRERGDWSGGMDFGYLDRGEREEVQLGMSQRSLDAWCDLLREADIPFAPVLDWRDVVTSEHAAANGLLAPYEYDGRRGQIPTSPISVTNIADVAIGDDGLAAAHRAKANVNRRPPDIGQDTESVLEQLGVPELLGQLRSRS